MSLREELELQRMAVLQPKKQQTCGRLMIIGHLIRENLISKKSREELPHSPEGLITVKVS